jgi:hypothetical protein
MEHYSGVPAIPDTREFSDVIGIYQLENSKNVSEF